MMMGGDGKREEGEEERRGGEKRDAGRCLVKTKTQHHRMVGKKARGVLDIVRTKTTETIPIWNISRWRGGGGAPKTSKHFRFLGQENAGVRSKNPWRMLCDRGLPWVLEPSQAMHLTC